MKQGMDLATLAETIEKHRSEKQDYLAPAGRLTLTIPEAGGAHRLVMDNGNGGVDLGMRDTAHAQFANRLKIPKKYYDRMRAEEPQLLADNVNRWLGREGEDRTFLLRSLGGNARALLSDRYRPLDNEALIEAILPTLLVELNDGAPEASKLRVESCNVSESSLYLKVVSPRIQGEIKKGDVIQFGAVFGNSEIGMRSLYAEPLLYRLVCLNGMVLNDSGMRRSHVGRKNTFGDMNLAEEYFTDATRQADDKALWLKVRDTVRHMFTQDAFDKLLGRWQATTTQAINHREPEKVVKEVVRKFDLGESEGRGVLRHLLSEGDMTRYGLTNSLTAFSQDQDVSYDRASELERIAGKLVELPVQQWDRIAQVERAVSVVKKPDTNLN